MGSRRLCIVPATFLVILVLAGPSVLASTFTAPVRITTNTGDSWYPSVTAVGNYVYVAWQDLTLVPGSGGGNEIWLRVSSNSGVSFGSAIRITTNTGSSLCPSVAADGSYVYVAWQDDTPVTGSGAADEIWLRASSNNGALFGSPVRITKNTGQSRYPSVAAAGSYVYVAWEDNTPVTGSGGSFEIWMRVSSNNGASFGSAIRITTNTGASVDPSVAAVGSDLYVAWADDTPVTGSWDAPEVWWRVSSNKGASFSSPMRITTNPGNSMHPSVAAVGDYVYVAWDDNTAVPGSGGSYEIWLAAIPLLLRYSLGASSGASLAPVIRISTNTGTSVNPSVAAVGSNVYLAWQDSTPVTGSGSNPEIWSRASSNNGALFGSPVRITTNIYASAYPSVAAAGSYVYVAWEDNTPVTGSGASYEIWCRAGS
jgi:hypothetical protein